MSARLFVGNLNPRTTKVQLAQFFAPAGVVISVSLPMDRDTGAPRGFGFVEFEDREAAELALSICDGRELQGSEIRLSWARERDEQSRPSSSRSARSAKPAGLPFELGDVEMGRGHSRGWKRLDEEDGKRARRPHKHGKHGSDRRRGRGMRRQID